MGINPPNSQSSKTGLIVTVNGTRFDVTTDPPLLQSDWGTVNAVLPPLQFAGGDSTTPLKVFGANQAAEFDGAVQVHGTLTADSAVEVKGGLTADSGLHGRGDFTADGNAVVGGGLTVN